MGWSPGILAPTCNLSSSKNKMDGPLPPDAPPVPPPPPTAAAGTWERATFERLMFATLSEQRAARRWKTVRSLAWLAFFIFIIWSLTHRTTSTADKTAAHTAVIEIKGEIAAGGEASAEGVV